MDSASPSSEQPAQPAGPASQPSVPAPLQSGKHACKDCGKEFGAPESLEQHVSAKHAPQQESRHKPAASIHSKSGRKKSRTTQYVIAFIIVVGLVYGYLNMGSKPDDLDGIRCESMEFNVMHIHPNLKIFVNGTDRVVAANIGVSASCMYWLHTHAPDGVIHVESPVKRNFTLGQFFKVWNRTQRDTLPFQLNATPSQVVVDGQNHTGNYWNITLADGQKIELHFP